ncbi:sugar ABC transporter ATP-binding protein [Alicyclobacillus vulcanalis]|uniref:sugar ABC transporter ATP-binding protein n=1 Tax=Alicyclobacillus vulcanalis TaxID=252246 RepID=UPI000970CDDE|nr:sugar ABC transporter ATP-binding protein [Alicyclobacillus vulcanalis]
MSVSYLEMREIEKSFSGVQVLRKVSLSVKGGEVHALLGENGAGKSTLMKTLAGVYQPDSGQILIDGVPQRFRGVLDSRRAGITIIHQELNLFPNLSIEENLLIGYEDEFRNAVGWVRYSRLRDRVRELLDRVGLDRDPGTPVSMLGIGERQLVEIARALQQDVRFLIMDEPTAALTDKETRRLFEIIEDLKRHEVGVIYISHRLEELFAIADRVTVLRDGMSVGTFSMREVSEDVLVERMVGRSVENRYPKVETQPGDVILELNEVKTRSLPHPVSITVRSGEIVGLGGMMGAGRTELARAITGVDRLLSGKMLLFGREVRFHGPRDAIAQGIAFVTEDRKDDGLLLPFSVRFNLALPSLISRQRFGFVLSKQEREFAEHWVKRLAIRVHSTEQPVVNLSGGNQQKVVFAKWLALDPKLLVLDEPTRGVDVGAKQEIYQLMNEMKARGKGVLVVSSDLPELLGICDRVYVLRDRAVVGELSGEQMKQEVFMTLVAGRQGAHA